MKNRQFVNILPQVERKHKIKRLNDIKAFKRENPKGFWREANKLGLGKTRTNIDCVNMLDGSVSHNTRDILQRWQDEQYNSIS